jgi:superfamily I DNA and/or RNA helicase
VTSRDLREGWGEVVDLGRLAERRARAAREELEELREEEAALHTLLSTRHEGNGAEGLQRDIAFNRDRIQSLVLEPDDVRAQILRDAQVIATTAHTAALGDLKKVDAVILDEASMVSLPIGLLTSLVGSRICLVGDPRQLGPVVQSRRSAAVRWMGTSLFEDPDAGGPGPSKGRLNGPLAVLEEQHRLPRAVAELVSNLSYGGRLSTTLSESPEEESAAALLGGALLYVDTGTVTASSRPRSRFPRENRGQARIVADLVQRALAGVPDLAGEVAVISPYRNHVSALRGEARRRSVGGDVRVSTVHRFQGRQCRLVIVSIPERPGEALSGFLTARHPWHEGGRLLTVALSRASECLVVVGNLGWLARAAPRDGMLLRALRLLRRHGKPCAPWGSSS